MKGLVLVTAAVSLAGTVSAAELAELIQNGANQRALALIEAGSDVNEAQGDGTTPLHWAVYRLDVELTQALLDAGADAEVQNRYGSTPLAEAVKAANAELVSMLLAAGADANAANTDGETTLMLAMRTGSVEVAAQLLEHDADPNVREGWREQSALMWAADSASGDLTRLLIEHGADVTARAAANDWGSQITSEPRAQYRPTGGLTPLLYAARSGCADCVAAILEAGADIDRPTPDGVTALMLAIDNFEFDTANLLLDAGANPHLSDWWGRTALYLAVDMNSYVPREPVYPRSTETTGMDLIRRLLADGVEVNPQLNMHRPGRGGNSARFVDDLLTTGAAPLLRAAIMHDHEAMRVLLEHGAHVDLPNVMGVTPLMAAAGIGVRDIWFGANRAPDFENDTEIEEKVIESLTILLEAGADINASVTDLESRTARIARISQMTGRGGQTALFSAAGRGWVEVVSFLVEQGAEIDIRDDEDRTARDIALTPVQGQPVPNAERIAEILASASAQVADSR